MVKTWKILLLWNQKADDLESLYAALDTQVPGTTKFIQIMYLGLPWPILRQDQIWFPMLLYGKKLKQWIFQKLL